MNDFEQEVFEYLNALRDSGVTNMLGAYSYIQDAFDLSQKEAKRLLIAWMESFG